MAAIITTSSTETKQELSSDNCEMFLTPNQEKKVQKYPKHSKRYKTEHCYLICAIFMSQFIMLVMMILFNMYAFSFAKHSLTMEVNKKWTVVLESLSLVIEKSSPKLSPFSDADRTRIFTQLDEVMNHISMTASKGISHYDRILDMFKEHNEASIDQHNIGNTIVSESFMNYSSEISSKFRILQQTVVDLQKKMEQFQTTFDDDSLYHKTSGTAIASTVSKIDETSLAVTMLSDKMNHITTTLENVKNDISKMPTVVRYLYRREMEDTVNTIDQLFVMLSNQSSNGPSISSASLIKFENHLINQTKELGKINKKMRHCKPVKLSKHLSDNVERISKTVQYIRNYIEESPNLNVSAMNIDTNTNILNLNRWLIESSDALVCPHIFEKMLLKRVNKTSSNVIQCHSNNILIQRRTDGHVNFSRSLEEYIDGFGDHTEMWFGLENLHLLTSQVNCNLLFRFKLKNGTVLFAEYFNVRVTDRGSNYSIIVNDKEFIGNISNNFIQNNKKPFVVHPLSTCNLGFFWQSQCDSLNLNGQKLDQLFWGNINELAIIEMFLKLIF